MIPTRHHLIRAIVAATSVLSFLVPIGALCAETPSGSEKIKTLMCVFCDSASDKGGKMSLTGTFDTLLAKSVPVKIAACTLCIRLQCLPTAYGDHKLRVEITKPDGKSLLEPKLERPFNLVPLQPAAAFLTKNLLINLTGLTLDQFGSYQVSVFIDDVLISDQQLLLNQVAPE
jgi:hypothetical protein